MAKPRKTPEPIDRETRLAVYETIADDLPDGASLALLEEMGLDPST